MKKNDWKKREGVVYSTNPDFSYEHGGMEEGETLPPNKQQLRVFLDASGRAGKQVTVVSGFAGKAVDCEALCKTLKTKCGTGGSVKEMEILIQGDKRTQVAEVLTAAGYRVR